MIIKYYFADYIFQGSAEFRAKNLSVYRALGNAELRILVRTFLPWDA